jgi:hypothetical protein
VALVWTIAVSRPSVSAPSAMRCAEAVRPPTLRLTPFRVSTIRTGLPTARAASAVRTVTGHTPIFPPNPPPTYGEITRTFAGGTANRHAICVRMAWMLCVVS